MVDEARKVFFVGIGGIGISALARVLGAQGRSVSGSDLIKSEISDELNKEGMEVKVGHKKENLPGDAELLVYSTAVPESNPERERARELGVPELSYPQALGELAKSYEKVIAVAGTNGKTTTTAMIGWILEEAGLDPTVVVGSRVLAWNSNARAGSKKFLVLEADEYRRAFLNYHPDIAIITNIEADHLDYFKGLEDIKSAFGQFIENLKPVGAIIYNQSNKNAGSVVSRFVGSRLNAIARPFSTAEAIPLKIPGRFNQENAVAAAEACRALGVSDEKIKSALASFTGTWRRFEKVGRAGETDIVSDYAHHPAGIKAVCQAALEVYKNPSRILLVFQPHQHNRTKMLFNEFVQAFCSCRIESIIISEIFDVAGREERRDQDISSRDLVEKILECGKKAIYAPDLNDCKKKVKQVIHNFDAVIFIGAGDIYKVADQLTKKSKNLSQKID